MGKQAAEEGDGLLGDLGSKSFPAPYPPQSEKKHIRLCIVHAHDNDSKNNDEFAYESTLLLLSVYSVPGCVSGVQRILSYSPHSSSVVWVPGLPPLSRDITATQSME